MIQQSHFWVFRPKELKSVSPRYTCTSVCIAALATTGRIWKQPQCPSTDEWIKTDGIFSWNIIQPLKKKGNPAILISGREYNMLSEISRTQKTNTVCSHLYAEPEIIRLLEAECRRVITRDCGEGKLGRWWLKGTKFQLCKINRFWRSIQHSVGGLCSVAKSRLTLLRPQRP